MEIKRCIKETFYVIGKEGSTNDGEAIDGTKAPEGWTKWTIPGYEYLYVKCTEENIFPKVIAYMREQGQETASEVSVKSWFVRLRYGKIIVRNDIG